MKFHYLNPAVSANGTFVSAQFSIAREVQEREGLLNSLLWFSSVFPGEGTGSAEALIHMKHRLNGKAGRDFGELARDLALLARHPIHTAGFVAARLLQPEWLIHGVNIDVICEPSPNRGSRVTLSNVRDRLGMPRPRLDWRLGEQVKRTFDRSIAIFAEELRDANVADVDVSAKLEGREWPEVPAKPWYYLGTWHHMGTTRMHDSSRHGVVDRDCKIHGMTNLYVAGSSVFPTYGANFSTFTIAALGLRLADHLAERARRPDAILETASNIGAAHPEFEQEPAAAFSGAYPKA